MNHDDDKTFQRVKDGEEDLEEGGAAVRDGQDGRHPGEGQQGQNHTGTPERRTEGLENTSDAADFFSVSVEFRKNCQIHHAIIVYLIKIRVTMIRKTYPARSFSFTSVIPSLETSLLKTRIPMTMFTCSWDSRDSEAMHKQVILESKKG